MEKYIQVRFNRGTFHPIFSLQHSMALKHPRSQSYSFPTHQGDSGRPVFNANYELVGLLFDNCIGVHDKDKKIYEYQARLIILSKELIELAKQI